MTVDQIIALIQGLGTLAIAAFILFQNKILNTQITNQNQMISNLKSFQEIIDIKKVREYVDLREETHQEKVKLMKSEFEKTLESELKKSKDEAEKTKQFYTETTLALSRLLVNLDEKERLKFMTANLKSNYSIYQKLVTIMTKIDNIKISKIEFIDYDKLLSNYQNKPE